VGGGHGPRPVRGVVAPGTGQQQQAAGRIQKNSPILRRSTGEPGAREPKV